MEESNEIVKYDENDNRDSNDSNNNEGSGKFVKRHRFLHHHVLKKMHTEVVPTTRIGRFRKRLARFLESKRFQYFIIGLIIVDLVLLIIELSIERESNVELSDTEETIERILYWLTVAVLIIFEAEILLLMFALGRKFFKNLLYVFDFIVITVAIILEVILRDQISGLLALFRFWRLARIGHAIFIAEEESRHQERELVKHLKVENEAIKEQNETLKEENQRLMAQIETISRTLPEPKSCDLPEINMKTFLKYFINEIVTTIRS